MQRRFPREAQELTAVHEFSAEFCASVGVDEPFQRTLDLFLEELFTRASSRQACGSFPSERLAILPATLTVGVSTGALV